MVIAKIDWHWLGVCAHEVLQWQLAESLPMKLVWNLCICTGFNQESQMSNGCNCDHTVTPKKEIAEAECYDFLPFITFCTIGVTID